MLQRKIVFFQVPKSQKSYSHNEKKKKQETLQDTLQYLKGKSVWQMYLLKATV